MRILQLEQQSADWLAWRQTGIGSSDAAAIVGISPWTTAEELWRQKRRLGGEKTETPSMAYGKREEPRLRKLYEALMGIAIEPVCGVDERDAWLKVSLDGWNGELLLAVEFKVANRADHAAALASKVPAKYAPQLEHQQLVSKARTSHYVSYSRWFDAGRRFAVVAVKPDEDRLTRLYTHEKIFYEHVSNGTPLPADWPADYELPRWAV